MSRETITVGKHTFEIVDFVPLGYEIWNIGNHMPDGYLPLCRLSSYQPFSDSRNIETDTLKAIKIEGAQIILDAVMHGAGFTLKEMELFVNRHKNVKPGTCAYDTTERCKKALPIMRQIKWH